MINQVIQGDCLEVMATLPSHSIDLIATDLPYGTTACKWDAVIPLEPMWLQFKRILKPCGAVVLTATQPFTTDLIASNRKWFKYSWVWDKKRGVGFQVAKYRPMMRHEDILVFGKSSITYNPEMVLRDKPKKSKAYGKSDVSPLAHNDGEIRNYTHCYPTSILEFSNASQVGKQHPTQKPVALFEYLIKTYSNPGDLVLDCTAGSGTTGVAAINTNRNFILIEKEQKHIDIIHKRLAQVNQQPRFDEMAG